MQEMVALELTPLLSGLSEMDSVNSWNEATIIISIEQPLYQCVSDNLWLPKVSVLLCTLD